MIASALALQGVAFKSTLTAGTHRPAVNARWPYVVKVVNTKGRPLRARITAQIVDPIGGVHPVEYFANTRKVTNIPFRGTFREAVKWPPESKGFRLVFRVIVTVGTAKRTLSYAVTPA